MSYGSEIVLPVCANVAVELAAPISVNVLNDIFSIEKNGLACFLTGSIDIL